METKRTPHQEQIAKWIKEGGNLGVLRNLQAYITVATKNHPQLREKYMGLATQEPLLDQLIPLFEPEFTEQELVEINAFYDSPIGLKLTDRLPKLSGQITVTSRAWGNDIVNQMAAEIPEAINGVNEGEVINEMMRLDRIDQGLPPLEPDMEATPGEHSCPQCEDTTKQESVGAGVGATQAQTV